MSKCYVEIDTPNSCASCPFFECLSLDCDWYDSECWCILINDAEVRIRSYEPAGIDRDDYDPRRERHPKCPLKIIS